VIAAHALRARFDAPDTLGIGIEEELFLLDPETLDLAPRAREVIERTGDDPRFKLELPASQLEIVTPPCPDVATAAAARTSRPSANASNRSTGQPKTYSRSNATAHAP